MKFPIVGFFEELMTVEEPRKCLGTRRIAYDPTRKLGSGGMREITITEPFELSRGHKTVPYRASQAKPVVVITMMQMMTGRAVQDSEEIAEPYYSTSTKQAYGIPNFVG